MAIALVALAVSVARCDRGFVSQHSDHSPATFQFWFPGAHRRTDRSADSTLTPHLALLSSERNQGSSAQRSPKEFLI